MDMTTTLRDGTLAALVEMLREQNDVKYDIVVTASRLSYHQGRLVVRDGAARFTDDGVSECDAFLAPTDVFEEGVAARLDIPRAYLRTLRQKHTMLTLPPNYVDVDAIPRDLEMDEAVFARLALIDANVNAWLQADPDRMFMVRGFRTDDPDDIGIARALLSNRYGAVDHYDMLLAVLDGARQAGLDTKALDVEGNLSERNMRVNITAPQIAALAPVLLRNYRSPFGGGIERVRDLAAREGMGYEPGSEPVIHAGIAVSNSETGGGAFTLMPRLVVQICRNGLTVKADMLRQVHVGGRLEEGIVSWSADTQRKNLDLVVAQTRDAVGTFLNEEYLSKAIERIEEKADTKVTNAADVIERVAKQHLFSEAEAASILDCFIASGDLTAGGVMNAVTAAAQTLPDPDRAAEFEDVALDVLDQVAALA